MRAQMIGEGIAAKDFSRALIERGVYTVNFSSPVVPRGTARIRTQISATRTTDDLDFAIAQFVAVREETDGRAAAGTPD